MLELTYTIQVELTEERAVDFEAALNKLAKEYDPSADVEETDSNEIDDED